VTGWLPADHPIYKNNQGSDPYVSIQLLEGVLRPARGGDGTFHAMALYAQPPNYSWNFYAPTSMYFSLSSPAYDLAFPPLFWYAEAIDAYVPSVGKSYSVARVG
jgi:peptide/nickel transport system substrate-binding protein